MAHYRLLLYTCFGGCATGVAVSKAYFRIWSEHNGDVKIGCLPAVVIPAKFREMIRNSDKRLLVDACPLKCGKKLAEKFGLPIDRYIELTSALKIRKVRELPSKELEEKIYNLIRVEVDKLLSDVK